MTVIGFDFGLARIGVAVTNTITGIATPLTTLHSQGEKPNWQGITAILDEWQPKQLVVGHPQYLDGTKSDFTLRAEKFARQLEGRYNLPVDLVNEALTSMEAEQRLKQTRQAGRKKAIKKDEIDQLAAAIILENWIKHYEQRGL